jgi:hypothetical protein
MSIFDRDSDQHVVALVAQRLLQGQDVATIAQKCDGKRVPKLVRRGANAHPVSSPVELREVCLKRT